MSSFSLVSPSTPLALALTFPAAISAVSSVTIQSRQLVRGGAPLAGSGELAGGVGRATITFTGGADGEQYDATVRATLAAGGSAEIELSLLCIEPAWTMADGAAGLVSIISFAESFGAQELIAATRAPGGETIDRPWLIAALRHAQALAMAEVARRYSLPLAFIPDVLKSAILDIAAERLFSRSAPPQHIADAAKVARRQLERIGNGDLPLTGLAGLISSTGGSEGGFAAHSGDASNLGDLGDYVFGGSHERY